MRVLLTGSRGLLGGAVTRELVARGHLVTTLQRHHAGHPLPVRERIGDINDVSLVADAVAGQDAVVHLAALVSMVGEWSDFVRVNVDGTRGLLDAARASGVRVFVHVSSPSVAHAGAPLVGAPAGPADPARARGNYARSKAMAEQLALAADGDDLKVTAVRPHLVWGPGDTQLVGRIADRALRGRLALVDGGRAMIDTTYVDNAAEAIAQALDRAEHRDVHGRAFVISNGEPRTVAELAGRIARAAGARPPSRSIPFRAAWLAGSALERAWARAGKPGEPPMTAFLAEQLATAHWFDQRTTRAALDWTPRVSLDEGFERLASWFGQATFGRS